MMSLNLTTINILNVHVVDYRYIISRIKKKWCNKLNAKYRFDWKKRNIIKHKNLSSHIKILTFGDIEIERYKIYHYKSPIF